MEYSYPENMTRRQAMTRRANMLIAWFEKDEWAIYVDKTSITKMVKLIKLIVWALERSIPRKDWEDFRLDFHICKMQITDEFGTEAIAKINYDEVVATLVSILVRYREYVGVAL